MAFDASQKDKLRLYMGFPSAYFDLNSRFESSMNTIGADATAQATVESLMASIVLVEAAMASTGTVAATQGQLKAITGDVEWYDTSDSASGGPVDARTYGKMLINRLAARFGFTRAELPSDYFGTGGWQGGEMALG